MPGDDEARGKWDPWRQKRLESEEETAMRSWSDAGEDGKRRGKGVRKVEEEKSRRIE